MEEDEEETEEESVNELLAKVIDTDYFDDNSYSDCIRAVQRLGDLREVRVVQPLLKLLAGEDFECPFLYDNALPYMSEHILKALEKIGEPAVPQLCDALEEWAPHTVHREEIAHILSKIGSSAAEETAMNLLENWEYDNSAYIRGTGAWLLGYVGTSKCVSKLKEALSDESESVEVFAKTALDQLVERKVISCVQPEA